MSKSTIVRALSAATIFAASAAFTLPAVAAGSHGSGQNDHGQAKEHGHDGAAHIGKPGKATSGTKIVVVKMYDNYYEPESLSVQEGQTVRFVIQNKGTLVHEFNIATAAMHRAHAPEMEMMMQHGVLEPDKINWAAAKKMQKDMGHGMHDEPNSALLEPGKSAEIVWTFSGNADLEFACNVPGHYDSGMVGKIKLSH
jgi:uncharacterized cupredoxin-like copper-binding protein